MCGMFLSALYTEVVTDSELQKSETVIQFMLMKYHNY